jgi:hypothetical protein
VVRPDSWILFQPDSLSAGFSFSWILIQLDSHSAGFSFSWILIQLDSHSAVFPFSWIPIQLDSRGIQNHERRKNDQRRGVSKGVEDRRRQPGLQGGPPTGRRMVGHGG